MVRDHDLVKRTHTYSIGSPESRETDEFSASLYGYEGERQGDYGASARHAMELTLRPGESIEFRWDHAGKQYTAGEPVLPGQAIRDGQGDLAAGWGPQAYRVVAIDQAGNESGPSDYAEAPRPLVWNRPERVAQAGKPYRFAPQLIRSDGDLRCRPTQESSYNAAFWDREEYRFTPARLPEGFALDAKTGLISGTPTKPGSFEVAIKIENQFGRNAVFSYNIAVR